MLLLPALQAENDFTPCRIPRDQTNHMHAVAFKLHILHVSSGQDKRSTCCGSQVYEQVTQSRNRLSTRLSAANKVPFHAVMTDLLIRGCMLVHHDSSSRLLLQR